MKNFALIGAAGFVAERHLKAIKETGNQVVVASDKFDVMGRMDSYFPNAEFFTEFSHFSEYILETQKSNNPIEYCSICSPNHLHRKHIVFSLTNSMDAICEKPLVIYPEEVEKLAIVEKSSGKNIYTILQLRHHPAIISLKEKIDAQPQVKKYDIDLTYITSRGKWYFKSWKGDVTKSGGVVANIGIHFFDMLMWIFGRVHKSMVHLYAPHKASGFLELEKARVRWYLSLDFNDIPEHAKRERSRTYRSIIINDEEIEFSEGFTNLHTLSYSNILAGSGFGLSEAAPGIHLTDQIRNSAVILHSPDRHPFLKL
ncbi:MAG: Gfo/Idh/MocA family oxidoreductase [Prolixibacteraceae bacterium]|nr:Gfo/Idh/MocA family oxidoreductase [Prolixibacteraceae bacterium]